MTTMTTTLTGTWAARLPDYVDSQGFPWWDEAPASADDDDYGVCAQCGADTVQGVCAYDSEHGA